MSAHQQPNWAITSSLRKTSSGW